MKHSKFQLEKFKLELRDFELDIIEDALSQYASILPPGSERQESIRKIINKLYSEAYN